MDKSTTNRVLYLTQYIKKKELSNFLDISRVTLDSKIKNMSWKKYQKEKIDCLFEKVKKIKEKGTLLKVFLKDNELHYEIKNKDPLKNKEVLF